MEQLRLYLHESLRQAHRTRRGMPAVLETDVRSYAHALREAGVPIERARIDMKELMARVREVMRL